MQRKRKNLIAKKTPGEKEVKIAMIVVKDKKAATVAIDKLKSGANFSTLCREISTDMETKEKGGELNRYLRKGQGNKDISSAVFKLANIGDFTKNPIKFRDNYYIFKLIDRQPVVFGTLDSKRKAITFEAKKTSSTKNIKTR